MSTREIIFTVIGIVVGFIVSKIIKIVNLNAQRKAIQRTLVDCLKYENELTKQLGASDMIEFTAKNKGKDFAIYYYGEIYRSLARSLTKKTDEKTVEIVNALGTFLSVALQNDIKEYQEAKKAKADAKKDK